MQWKKPLKILQVLIVQLIKGFDMYVPVVFFILAACLYGNALREEALFLTDYVPQTEDAFFCLLAAIFFMQLLIFYKKDVS